MCRIRIACMILFQVEEEYIFDVMSEPKLMKSVTQYSLVTTVALKKALYTRSDVGLAEKSRQIQERLGWPSNQE